MADNDHQSPDTSERSPDSALKDINLGQKGWHLVRIIIYVAVAALAVAAIRIISSRWDIIQEQLYPGWLFAIVIILVLVIIVAVAIWGWEVNTDEPHKSIDMKVKINLGIVAAVVSFIIGVGGIIITDKQVEIGRYQTEIDYKRSETAEKHVAVVLQGQYTEIFTRAVEQVASQDVAIRLGGLISLESLSYENQNEYKRVWGYLGHFLRAPPKLSDVDENQKIGERQDIQHITDMLKDDRSKKILKKIKKFRLPLYGANLEGANLENTDLQDVDLRYAMLQGANLEDTDLQDVDLRYAMLQGANLQGIDLTGANLLGADLRGANLSGANLRWADLNDTYLQGANLRGADLSGAYMIGTNLRGADLNQANLRGALFGRTNRTRRPQDLEWLCENHTSE